MSEPSSAKAAESGVGRRSGIRRLLRRRGAAEGDGSGRTARYAAAICVAALVLAAVQGVTVQKIGFGPLQISFSGPGAVPSVSATDSVGPSVSTTTSASTSAALALEPSATPTSTVPNTEGMVSVHGTHAEWKHGGGTLSMDVAVSADSGSGLLTLRITAVNHTDVSVALSLYSMLFQGSVGGQLTPQYLDSHWGSAQEFLAVGASGTGSVVFRYLPKVGEQFTLTWPSIYQTEDLSMDHIPWAKA